MSNRGSVRRDLSQFGEFGRPSVGYETSVLRECLSEILHLNVERSIVWVGAARLEADKSLLHRFKEHKYHISAIFDTDLSRCPEMIGGMKVTSVADMPQMLERLSAQGAIIATAAEDAQSVADSLVGAGILGILNLTSTLIVTPPEVCVRHVDIVAELFELSYHCGEVHGIRKRRERSQLGGFRLNQILPAQPPRPTFHLDPSSQ